MLNQCAYQDLVVVLVIVLVNFGRRLITARKPTFSNVSGPSARDGTANREKMCADMAYQSKDEHFPVRSMVIFEVLYMPSFYELGFEPIIEACARRQDKTVILRMHKHTPTGKS